MGDKVKSLMCGATSLVSVRTGIAEVPSGTAWCSSESDYIASGSDIIVIGRQDSAVISDSGFAGFPAVYDVASEGQ